MWPDSISHQTTPTPILSAQGFHDIGVWDPCGAPLGTCSWADLGVHRALTARGALGQRGRDGDERCPHPRPLPCRHRQGRGSEVPWSWLTRELPHWPSPFPALLFPCPSVARDAFPKQLPAHKTVPRAQLSRGILFLQNVL